MIAVAALVAAIVAAALSTVDSDRRLVIIALTTVAGGVTFPLYSLCNAHLNDYLDSELVVAGGARMVLVNGVGAVAGPIVGAFAIQRFGPGGLFVVVAVCYVIVGVYSLYRTFRRAAVAEDERAPFLPTPVGLGATAPLADPDVDEAFPVAEGVAVAGEVEVAYRERGVGVPVVVVAEPGDRPERWEELVAAMAADGLRAIAPTLADEAAGAATGGEGEPADPAFDGVLALLRHLDLPSATFVGIGARAPHVRAFVEAHPDRVDAVVLVVEQADLAELGDVGQLLPPALLLDRGGDEEDPEEVADDITDFLRLDVTHEGRRVETV